MIETKNHEEILYAIAVYGYAPEFWPAAAYRRQGHTAGNGRLKDIKCPYCGKLLLTVNITRKLELFRFAEKVKAECHEYRKCKACFENIGIIFLAG